MGTKVEVWFVKSELES